MILVKFIQKCSPWNIGEQAGFSPERALELVSRGVAELVDHQRPVVEDTVIAKTPVDRMIRRGGRG